MPNRTNKKELLKDLSNSLLLHSFNENKKQFHRDNDHDKVIRLKEKLKSCQSKLNYWESKYWELFDKYN